MILFVIYGMNRKKGAQLKSTYDGESKHEKAYVQLMHATKWD